MIGCCEPKTGSQEEIVLICSWCCRLIGEKGKPKGAFVSPLFMEWIQDQGILASHGVCVSCKKDLV